MPKSTSTLSNRRGGSAFPDPRHASRHGLVAYGNELTPPLLIDAYSHGIFPWFDDDSQPVLWWSPDPRAVMAPADMHVSKSLRKKIRAGVFRVTADMAFAEVAAACAEPRANSAGTWITRRMLAAYEQLHDLGFAHSVETWIGKDLAGGLYGVSLGRMFFGESMFSRVPDASKVALAHLAAQLRAWDFILIDCQIPTGHLASLGAREMPRRTFLELVAANRGCPDRRGRWILDDLAFRDAGPGTRGTRSGTREAR
ncbi:MAG: leucyl/phenylalanyl-tRNA--protein transferase [Gammaproteobacteria bacterium]|nr:leucyl/phenylalanyl-tRNA--protein transferase [Gammaproteobacteria bacterium]